MQSPNKRQKLEANGLRASDKGLKKDVAQRPIYGHDKSQESEDSEHEEVLEKAFGVTRGRNEPNKGDENSALPQEYRRKEAEWRRHNLA